jgi:hypothetical protein
MKLVTALVVFSLIFGAGLFVYNLDDVYLDDKSDITMSFSNNFRSGGEAPVVITVSDFNGEPIADKEVKIELAYEVENKTEQLVLTKTKTDSDGVVTPVLELPDQYNGTAKLVIKMDDQRVEQPIVIEEPEGVFTKSDEERLRILISTDKPLYQPGQIINIRVLAMYGETKGVYTKNITIEVDDPEGNKLFRKELDCNAWGITSTNFTVTDQMALGNYKILAKVGEKESKKSVTIKEYVLPRFNIIFNDIKSWYTVDEDISGKINVKYFFGKPVKGNIQFKARTSYGGAWDTVYQTSSQLTENGEFEFRVPAVNYATGMPILNDNGLVELNATISDPSGHTETKLMPVTIARKPILLTTISDTNIRGAESKFYVLAQAPDGSIVAQANITAKLDSVETYSGSTNAKGLTSFLFNYNGQEELTIAAEKGSLKTEETIEIKESTGIKLTTDKMYCAVGDLTTFEVFYSGDSFTKWVYYDVISDGFTVNTGAFKLSSGTIGTGSFELDITPEMVGTTYVRVYKIEKNDDVVTDRIALAVAPTSELQVDIQKDDEIYNPHQPVVLSFKVTESGEPVQGALGVAIIDQSLYALTEQYGGFSDLYFELEEIAMEPQYMIWSYVFDSEGIDSGSDVVPLPETNILDPGEYEQGYAYPQIGIQSNHNVELENAQNSKEESVSIYWAGVFILIFVGLLTVAFYGIKAKRPGLVVAILGILIIGTVLGGVALNIENLESITQTGGLYDGLSHMEGDAVPNGGGGNTTGGGTEFDEGTDTGQKAAEDVKPPNWRPGFNIMDNEVDIRDDSKDYDSDLIPDTNEGSESTSDPGAIREELKVRVRNYFPETWYWNPVLITDESGTAEIELTTPDSITTWEIKAVGSTKNAKIGVTNQNLTVFQQFFIEPDIPVSVVRNDTFPLRIMVYNYDNISREVTVYLQDDTWFEVLDETIKKVTVPADNVSKVMFTIRALDVGEHNVTISGYNGQVWDDVIKPMRVDPDGKRVSQTFNGKLSDNHSATEAITLSKERVPGSEDVFVKLQGGMEAVVLDGAEQFIRFVSGCGEQSMSTLNIDILAFDTVQKVGTATEEKMFEYETIVTQGIQHELQYLVDAKNGKGRGIVWFPEDEDVHQWLTSWGLITFQDAVDAGFAIDPDIIQNMQSWLVSQQETDGSFVFPERGLYEYTNPILRAKTVSCSAYITRSLIYSGYSTSSPTVQKAVNYIEDHAKDDEVWNDPYSLSLVLIVLEDGNGDSSLRTQLTNRLEDLKKEDTVNKTAWWTSGTSMITDSDDMGWEMEMDMGWRYGGGSDYHTIETTGYAVMALAKAKGAAGGTVQKGVKYLLENRQGLGGWFSTQDTVVSFQALKIAGMNDIDELTVQIIAGGKEVTQIKFDESNIDLTYLIDLRPYMDESTDIKLKSTGSGSIMYQIYYEEYIPWHIIGAEKPKELILNITYDTTEIKVNDQITATLDLKYQGAADHIKMVLVDLRAPVGFSFVENDFKTMKLNGDISQYEINNRQAYLYIEDLTYGETITVTYHLKANDPIHGTIQGVQVYDMYNPGLNTEIEPIEVVAVE